MLVKRDGRENQVTPTSTHPFLIMLSSDTIINFLLKKLVISSLKNGLLMCYREFLNVITRKIIAFSRFLNQLKYEYEKQIYKEDRIQQTGFHRP